MASRLTSSELGLHCSSGQCPGYPSQFNMLSSMELYCSSCRCSLELSSQVTGILLSASA